MPVVVVVVGANLGPIIAAGRVVAAGGAGVGGVVVVACNPFQSPPSVKVKPCGAGTVVSRVVFPALVGVCWIVGRVQGSMLPCAKFTSKANLTSRTTVNRRGPSPGVANRGSLHVSCLGDVVGAENGARRWKRPRSTNLLLCFRCVDQSIRVSSQAGRWWLHTKSPLVGTNGPPTPRPSDSSITRSTPWLLFSGLFRPTTRPHKPLTLFTPFMHHQGFQTLRVQQQLSHHHNLGPPHSRNLQQEEPQSQWLNSRNQNKNKTKRKTTMIWFLSMTRKKKGKSSHDTRWEEHHKANFWVS